MIKLMSVKDLQMKIAKAEGAKATAVLRTQKAGEEQALLDHLLQPSGLSDDVVGEKASAIINRAVDGGISGCDLRGSRRAQRAQDANVTGP